ncbi:hypothetical protein CJF32_00010721 [Rutstroemia sp. NJR-2017a WRK4]|nr:hypothetical protein CJF32_00010721 [Rutstroemia sp. NJR-2017a WRK4]
MSNAERSPSPEVQIVGDDGRVWIEANPVQVNFFVGDNVYLIDSGGSRYGPYQVAQVTSTGKYLLCDSENQWVRNGEEIEGKDLEAVP